MYIPSHFEVKDRAKIDEVITANSFAQLVSRDGDSLFASHLPFLYYPEKGTHGVLASHMARANRHWQLFAQGGESLVVFNGPHAYISPSWYVTTEGMVPTWNYITVHVYGRAQLVATDDELGRILDETVAKNEAGFPMPWTPNLPPDLKAKFMKAIVGFEIEITRIEGKFKLGQNRTREDREKMMRSLEAGGDPDSVRLAEFMRREFQD
jgi:transcriptional regulator